MWTTGQQDNHRIAAAEALHAGSVHPLVGLQQYGESGGLERRPNEGPRAVE